MTPLSSAPEQNSLRLGLLLISSALLLTACPTDNTSAEKTTEAPTSSAPLERKVRVQLLTPAFAVLSSERSVSVTLNPRRSANVAAQASGPVSSVLVTEGERVQAGQSVLKLENTNAQNALSDAKLALESAKINLQKALSGQSGTLQVAQDSVRAAQENADLISRRLSESRELLTAGGIAAIDVQQLEANYTQAQSSLRSAQDQVSRAQRSSGEDVALLEVQLRQAQNRIVNSQKTLRDTDLKAPFSGIISDLPVQQGEFLSAGSKAFVLADTSMLEAKFRLPPEQAETLVDGSTLTLTYGGKNYPVKLVSRTTVPGQDRQIELTARVPALATGVDIPIGATANLRYKLRVAKGLIVPSGAVRVDPAGGGNVVFANTGGKATSTPVKVLGEAEGKVALEGLPKSARVVYPLPSDVVGGETLEVVK